MEDVLGMLPVPIVKKPLYLWRVMTVCRSDVQVAAHQFHRLRCSALDFQPVLTAQIEVRLAADIALLVRQGMKLLEVSALSGDPRRPLLHVGKHVRKADNQPGRAPSHGDQGER